MGAPGGGHQPRFAKDLAVRAWHIIRSRLRSLVFRGSRESDLSEELQLHLERETERLLASGLSRDDARFHAMRLFGGVEQIKEECRDGTEERPGAPLVAVLGHQAWTRVFRADPSVVGRVVRIDGLPVTIVGIGPANHRGTVDVGLVTDFWLPITALREMDTMPAMRDAPTILAPLFVKARLQETATVAQATAAMAMLARRLEAEYPDLFRAKGEFALGTGITVLPTTDVRVHPQADVPIMALASLVLVIVSLVLATDCSNLATLLAACQPCHPPRDLVR
jgi:hypothetical protein